MARPEVGSPYPDLSFPQEPSREVLERCFRMRNFSEDILRYIVERRQPQISDLVFVLYTPKCRGKDNDVFRKIPVGRCWGKRTHFTNAFREHGREVFAIAICSRVFLRDGTTTHIPMIDFDCERTDESVNLIKEKLKAAGEEEGTIILTENSFQYIGFRLMNDARWLDFLGKMFVDNLGRVDGECVERRLVDPYFIGYTLTRRVDQSGLENYRFFGCLRLIDAWPVKKSRPTFYRLL